MLEVERLEVSYGALPALHGVSLTIQPGEMVALGRALMGLPRLLLLDEPSLGLAPRVVESIFSILAELHREGMSLLIVEQNVQAVLKFAQRAYILEGGKIVGEGEGQRLLQD